MSKPTHTQVRYHPSFDEQAGCPDDPRTFEPVFLGNRYQRDAIVLESIQRGSRVLDVGCADGRLGEVLETRGCTVTGVELTPILAERARARLSRVYCGDAAALLTEGKIKGPFDVVLCADILEHLADPWGVLRLLVALLAPSGLVVASIPNVGFIATRTSLALGRLQYSQAGGAFDIGHLRFFTLRTARDLVSSAGLEIVRTDAVPWTFRGQRLERIPLVRSVARLVNGPAQSRLATVGPGLFAMGFVLTGRKVTGRNCPTTPGAVG